MDVVWLLNTFQNMTLQCQPWNILRVLSLVYKMLVIASTIKPLEVKTWYPYQCLKFTKRPLQLINTEWARGHLSSSYNPKKVQTFKKTLILFTILRRDIEPLGIEGCTLSDQLKWHKVQMSMSFYSLVINEFSYLFNLWWYQETF